MKTRTLVSISILVFAVLIFVGSCATGKKSVKENEIYMPVSNEEIFGTWVNTNDPGDPGSPLNQKKVITHWGYFEFFSRVDSTSPSWKGTQFLVDKWTDSEGNIWYKEYRMESFHYGASRRFCLDKISNNGNTYEFIWSSFDFPTEDQMNPDGPNYCIYYRQEQLNTPSISSASGKCHLIKYYFKEALK